MKKLSLIISALILGLSSTNAYSVQKLDLVCVYETPWTKPDMSLFRVIVVRNDKPVSVRVASNSEKKVSLREFAIVILMDPNNPNRKPFYLLPKGRFKLTPLYTDSTPFDPDPKITNYTFSDYQRKANYVCSVNGTAFPAPAISGSN